jgi:hypothetical protein
MTTIKPLTAARLHSILRKAGFRRSSSHPTRVRGWHRVTAGYSVDRYGVEAGAFLLTYKNDSQGTGREIDPSVVLALYARALDSAGLSIENDGDYGIIVR